MGKIRNIIWTGYNGGSRGGAPEGRKFFKKIFEICNVKLKKLITFQKLHDFLHGSGQKLKNNRKFSPTPRR